MFLPLCSTEKFHANYCFRGGGFNSQTEYSTSSCLIKECCRCTRTHTHTHHCVWNRSFSICGSWWILWQRIRLKLINFTHVPPQPPSCLTTLLIIKNQSAAQHHWRTTCIHTLLIRAPGINTHKCTYINTVAPAWETWGNLNMPPCPASNRRRWRV